MSDSARWCDLCQRYGDHHTDRHVFPKLEAKQRTIRTTPFIEALVHSVQTELSHNRRKKISFNEALQWILNDFAWTSTDKPAFGHYSPVLYGHVKKVLDSAEKSK